MKVRYSEIRGRANGQKVFIVGGGTSLTGFNFSRLDNKFTIVVNHTIEHYDNCNCALFSDKVFLKKTPYDFSKYNGLIFANETTEYTKKDTRPNVYEFESNRGEVTLNPRKGLFHPTSSGMLAINLALQMRAKKIYLLGFDYYYKRGKIHFYEDYDHHGKYPEERIRMKLKKFKWFDRYKDKIINLNMNSHVPYFKKQNIDEVI